MTGAWRLKKMVSCLKAAFFFFFIHIGSSRVLWKEGNASVWFAQFVSIFIIVCTGVITTWQRKKWGVTFLTLLFVLQVPYSHPFTFSLIRNSSAFCIRLHSLCGQQSLSKCIIDSYLLLYLLFARKSIQFLNDLFWRYGSKTRGVLLFWQVLFCVW